MSYKKCVTDELAKDAEGVTKQERESYRDELLSKYDEYYDEFVQTMNPAQAAAKAGQKTAKQKAYEKRLRKYRKLLQYGAWSKIKQDMGDFRTLIKGEKDIYEGAKAIFTYDQASKFTDLHTMTFTVEQDALRRLDGFLGSFKRDILTRVRNKEELDNVVRRMLGDATAGTGETGKMATAVSKVLDDLRKRFNRAGGTIGKIDNYFPVTHNSLAVRNASFKAWYEFVRPKLNPQKMINNKTNEAFGDNEGALKEALEDVYESIRTNGMSKVAPGKSAFARSTANKRADHRFLAFNTAEDFLKYNDKFGEGNAFDIILAHINSMSKDIAIMERLGPNPNATVKYIQQTLEKTTQQSKETGKAFRSLEDKSKKASQRVGDYYDYITGDANSPVSSLMGNWFAGLRNLLTSAQLGGAFISAITDLNSSRVTRAHIGLPQWNTLSDVIRLMAVGEKGIDRGKLAVRLGLISEGWTAMASHQMRIVGEFSGPEFTKRISDVVMKASLLSPWTQANRWAFGQEFLGFMADNSNKAFGELDEAFRKTLDAYGIDSKTWDTLRKTDKYVDDETKADFFSIENLRQREDLSARQKDQLVNRVLGMINTETNFAVPSSSLKGRTAFTGNTRPGTVPGELMRSVLMYKNFGITVINTHIMRMIAQTGWKNKAAYFGNFIAASTVLGGVALQMKDIAKGRDPRPIDEKFILAAMAQGGGWGIFGDFLFSDMNRYGKGGMATAAGPVYAFGEDTFKLTLGNIQQLLKGEETKFASELVDMASRYTPGGSLWYSRLAMERMILDQLKLLADPDAQKKMNRYMRKRKKEFNQTSWWRKGQMTPDRSPQFENIIGR
tara:strand:+ start:6025 stop:8544 length:2520 start_codon:yes stop_codon:yes gene_type:complete